MSILHVMNLIVYLSHRGITLHATRTCFALVSWEMLWYLNNTCHRLISCREQLPESLSIKSCQSKKCFAIKLFLFWIGWCLWEMQSYVIAVRVTWEEFCLISLQCDWEPTDSWTPRIMGSSAWSIHISLLIQANDDFPAESRFMGRGLVFQSDAMVLKCLGGFVW